MSRLDLPATSRAVKSLEWIGSRLERLHRSKPLYIFLVVLTLALFAVRFFHLEAGFDSFSKRYSGDGVLYTDEGWYANNAIYLYRLGSFYREGESNFAINLPVLQILHTISFFIFGPTIIAARLTIIVCFAGTLFLLFHLLKKLEGPWTALVAVLWVCGNYFYLIYSRFAIAEIPMTFFVTLALYLASRATGPRALLIAAGAGLSFAVAFYTKTSAVFALPLLLGILFLLNRKAEPTARKWLTPLAAAATFAAVCLLHTLLIARAYPDDYQFFHSINVGMNAKIEITENLRHAVTTAKRLSDIDDTFHTALPIILAALFVLSPGFRRNPLVWICLLWLVMYLGMFTFYVNMKPRYWAALFVPLSALIAISFKHVYLLGTRNHYYHLATIGFILLFALSARDQLKRGIRYFREPDYSFSHMAEDVKRVLDADPGSRNIIMGHFVTTLALYEDVIPVNEKFSPSTLSQQIERHRPVYLLTEGSLYERDWKGFVMSDHEGPEDGERLRTLKQYYSHIEHVKDYEVYRNYMGWPIKLYRLFPKEEIDDRPLTPEDPS